MAETFAELIQLLKKIYFSIERKRRFLEDYIKGDMDKIIDIQNKISEILELEAVIKELDDRINGSLKAQRKLFSELRDPSNKGKLAKIDLELTAEERYVKAAILKLKKDKQKYKNQEKKEERRQERETKKEKTKKKTRTRRKKTDKKEEPKEETKEEPKEQPKSEQQKKYEQAAKVYRATPQYKHNMFVKGWWSRILYFLLALLVFFVVLIIRTNILSS